MKRVPDMADHFVRCLVSIFQCIAADTNPLSALARGVMSGVRKVLVRETCLEAGRGPSQKNFA